MMAISTYLIDCKKHLLKLIKHQTQNFFASDCSMRNVQGLATTQPGIMYNGGYNSGAGGCNIDIQTFPSAYMFGCHILETNFISGGLLG